MKILLITPISHNKLFALQECLQSLNHEVCFFGTQSFEEQVAYAEKKLYKLGLGSLKEKYYRKLNEKIEKGYLEFNPDLVFITNGGGLSSQLLSLMKKKTNIIAWFFDSVKRDFMEETAENFVYYDKIFVFEKSDIPYIKEKYGLDVQYCSVGYNNKTYYPVSKEKNIDIVFVGNPSPKRIAILREVANYASSHNLTMQIYGAWYSEQHFWKKIQFKKRDPILFQYINNRTIPSEIVADLYRQSKICLNIHIAIHEGVNPRTFEILGTRSFQLIDKRQDYNELIRPNVDVVVYEDVADLISKIDYYLSKEKERNVFANNGYEWVKDRLSMSMCLKTILNTELN